jgi:hypothetical protein
MSTPTAPASESLRDALYHELLRLAQHEDDVAACEAERVHYWETMPVSVSAHRRCADALRAVADELLAAADLESDR